MGGPRILAIVFAAFVAANAGMSPAAAQCRLCETPITARDDPSAVGDVALEVETNLDFDRLIVAGQGQGWATLRPDGSRIAQGALLEVGPRAMVGMVTVRGKPNRPVRVELPRQITLHSLNGGQIIFDDVASNLPAFPRLDSAGRLAFSFGGRLTVSGDSDGDYRGELPIIVEYP